MKPGLPTRLAAVALQLFACFAIGLLIAAFTKCPTSFVASASPIGAPAQPCILAHYVYSHDYVRR
jgi:hypothetical protein